jgi:hypothetical protein
MIEPSQEHALRPSQYVWQSIDAATTVDSQSSASIDIRVVTTNIISSIARLRDYYRVSIQRLPWTASAVSHNVDR